MTAETSNARWEWVLVPRELLEAAVCPMKESGCDGTQYPVQPYGEGEQCQWCCERRASLTAPPPAAAEPKTLPVPTRVYLTDKAAVIVGDPQRGWDEEGPEAHNCDDMGCSTIGPHVLARVPFTDERALSQQPEAQGGGEVAAWETEDGRVISARQKATALRDGGASASSVAPYTTPLYRTAPPSAPVGVELSALRVQEWLHREHDILCPVQEIEQAMRTPCSCPFTERALAQQPAAVDGAARRRDVRLWMRHNAGSYSTATELAEAADEVFNLPDGGLDNETHWVWDEAAEAVDDSQRGGLA